MTTGSKVLIAGAISLGAYAAYKMYQAKGAVATAVPATATPNVIAPPAISKIIDKLVALPTVTKYPAPLPTMPAPVSEILKPSVVTPTLVPAVVSVKIVNETITVPGTNEVIQVPTIKPIVTKPAVIEPVYSAPVNATAPIKTKQYLAGCLI